MEETMRIIEEAEAAQVAQTTSSAIVSSRASHPGDVVPYQQMLNTGTLSNLDAELPAGVTFDLASIKPEHREVAIALVPTITDFVLRAIAKKLNTELLPKINNTIEWVNHTTIDGDDILASYKDHCFSTHDEETGEDHEAAVDGDVHVLGKLVRML